VAGKGLSERKLTVDSLKLDEEGFGELNTETQSTQRSETGTDLEMRAPSKLRVKGREVGLAAIMGNDSKGLDYCQDTVL